MEEVKNKPFGALKASFIALFASVLLCVGIAFVQTPEKAYAAEADKYMAQIEIKDYGTVTVELDRKAAPITVDNFVNLARSGFYDGLTFHRVEWNVCIQGGDPKGDGTGGSGTNIPGEFSKNGWDNPISHTRGVISMARASDYNSASSQFFITLKDTPSWDGEYAAFGHVTSGMDVVDSILNTKYIYGGMFVNSSFKNPVISTIKVAPVVSSKGWVKKGNRWWYKYDAAQQAATGKRYPANEAIAINGKWYQFDANGYMVTGWKKANGNWYYYGSDGAMKTGWQKVKGKWYYLGNGAMQTGKKQIGEETYYLTSSGAMKTGWSLESGKWYYYKPSGAMYTGTLTWVRNGYYLFGFDGAMITGMYTVNEDKYYFDKSSGKMKTGWVKDGAWYYFNNWGIMQKGWQKVKGKWYYLNPEDGKMQTGLFDVGNTTYYTNGSGVMQTGWKLISGKYYYFNKSGAMQKNKWVGNYYVGSDGVMATNTWIGPYHVNAQGKWDATNNSARSATSAASTKSAPAPESTTTTTTTTNDADTATDDAAVANSASESVSAEE